MAVYNTIQRKELTAFLQSHSDQFFTIDELFEGMKNDSSLEKVPSRSTLYRLVREMISDGKLRRIIKEDNRESVYQYIADEKCCEHLHVKCSVCGQVYHLSEEATKEIIENIKTSNSFTVDVDTILTGKCSECK